MKLKLGLIQKNGIRSFARYLLIMKMSIIIVLLTSGQANAINAFKMKSNDLIVIVGGDSRSAIAIPVTGTITDENGQPLEGVSIFEKGTSNGTSTDKNGVFNINVRNRNSLLVFTSVGYQMLEVTVGDRTVINVSLISEVRAGDEVVVVGYRTQTRGTVTGSISTVSGSEISNTPSDNLSNSLAGRLSGTTITQGAGTPGMESTIRIRTQGTFNNSNPLFVIDGVVSDKFAFDGLSPNEVESVTVLKDGASAAIYGSRAANGVILVTTKRGSSGGVKMNYNGMYGFQDPTQIPKRLNALQHAQIINQKLQYTKVPESDARYYTQDELDYFSKNSWDWIKEMWKAPATTQHTLDVSGGGQNVRYFLGGSYNYSTGSFNNLDFQRYTLRSNIDANITKSLKLLVDINTTERKTDGPSWDVNNWRQEDLYKALLIRSAMVPPYVNGLPVGNWVEWHPGVVVDPALAGYNKRRWKDLNTTITFLYSVPFVKGLSAKIALNKRSRELYTKQFNLPYNMTLFNTTGEHNHIVGDQPVGIRPRAAAEFLMSREDKYEYYQFNAQLNYKRSFGGHNLDAIVVYEQAEDNSTWFSGRRDDFLSPVIDQFVAGSTVNSTVDGRENQSARISYVGLLSYNYLQRYLLESSFRYDGSVIFAPDRRWGFFPSASLGWRISNEPFFKSRTVNDLKLRASIGKLGNDAVGGWQWLQSYNIRYGAIFDDQSLGIEQGVLANPLITWEKSINYNLGIDSRLWNNLNFKVDLFKRHSYDILGSKQLSIPSTFGASMPDENYQEIDAKGIELELGYDNKTMLAGREFSYYIKGNFSYSTNEIIAVDEAQNIRPYQSAIGRPVGLQSNGNINRKGNYSNDMLFGYVATGILRTQADVDALPAGYTILGVKPQLGMLNYKDLRGPNTDEPDGKITSDDREFLGKYSIPPMSYGMSLGFGWGSFNVDILVQGLAGAKAMLPTAGRDVQARAEESSFAYWADSWTPDNINGAYPGYRVQGYRTRFDASSFWLVDNSFLRLKNAGLSYTLPKSVLTRVHLKNTKVFFTGSNLLMIFQKNKIYDPEQNNILSYPIMRGYNFGINIGL